MVAPSPDWFVAARDVALCRDGAWVSEVSVPLDTVYDAGTDDGESRLAFPYVAAPDFDRNPQAPISIDRTHFSGSLGTMVFRRVR